jgi:tetraprenyl-beta-curcumene synthase
VTATKAGKPPTNVLALTYRALRRIIPHVGTELRCWRSRAEAIPNPELRKQALVSIDTKAFHCVGGGMYGLLSGTHLAEVVQFIVAYQTISDYLDNLCDRSTSLDAADFRQLHSSMGHALTPGIQPDDYYRLRDDRDDGGYLAALVATCQNVLAGLPGYEVIAPHLHRLAAYYCDLQVHKHIHPQERVPVMQAWFAEHQESVPPMTWYEFAACSGSTLGIFALVANAAYDDCDAGQAHAIAEAHFPWVQGLHILMDYLIDQAEDREGGDLNFCVHYPDEATTLARLSRFYREADAAVAHLPDRHFHRFMNRGLLAIYSSDPKVRAQTDVQRTTRALLLRSDTAAWLFYLGCRLYRRLAPKGLLGAP